MRVKYHFVNDQQVHFAELVKQGQIFSVRFRPMELIDQAIGIKCKCPKKSYRL